MHLDKSVTFYGRCDQETMSKVYNRCTIAVASLGLHRIGLRRASTLKTREYLAKGIPFVYSGEIDVIQDDPVDFCFQVPDDDNPIDIAALVEFHDSLYKNSEEAVIGRVREYAKSHVGMDVAMGTFVSYIKEICKNDI